MRAILHERYADPGRLRAGEIERPSVAAGEALVRVQAASVNPADWHYATGRPYLIRLEAGLARPKRGVLGLDVAGVVEEVGEGADGLGVGDRVFGETPPGSFAELASAPVERLCPMPDGASFEEAACLPIAGLTALQGLRDHGGLEAGQRVLINGASGGVGTMAVQIARSMGAEVAGVCSGRNTELVRSLGADRVIDYQKEDLTSEPGGFDVMLDMVGNHPPSACRRLLASGGRYVAVGAPMGNWVGPLPRMARCKLASLRGSERFGFMLAKPTPEDLRELKRLVEAGQLKPVISRRWSLEEVPEALRVQREGHVRGKAVVVLGSG